MTKYDLYWQSDPSWYGYEECDDIKWFLTENAPIEARESFERFLEQVKRKKASEQTKLRDKRIDGEYDPPLPKRIVNPTEEDLKKLEKLLEKYPNLRNK